MTMSGRSGTQSTALNTNRCFFPFGTLYDGSIQAVFVQTTDGEFGFEIEYQVKRPDSMFWKSINVVGPFKNLLDAVEEAERLYRGHKLLLV